MTETALVYIKVAMFKRIERQINGLTLNMQKHVRKNVRVTLCVMNDLGRVIS